MDDVYGVEICRYESVVQIVTYNHTAPTENSHKNSKPYINNW